MAENLYKILGIDETATPAEIKRAYRSRAKTMHPDKGGENGEFILLKEAYIVLSSPAKRKLYDETGTIEKEHSIESEAHTVIATATIEAIEKGVSTRKDVDFIEWLKAATKTNIRKGKETNKKIKNEIDDLGNFKSRIKFKGTEDKNIFNSTIKAKTKNLLATIHNNKHKIAIYERVIEKLKNYTMTTDNKIKQNPRRMSTATTIFTSEFHRI